MNAILGREDRKYKSPEVEMNLMSEEDWGPELKVKGKEFKVIGRSPSGGQR